MKLTVLTYLLILSVQDLREKQIAVGWLIGGSICAAGYALWQLCSGAAKPQDLMLACLPGILLLLLAFAGNQIGRGDGWVLLIVGCMIPAAMLLAAFWVSLVLMVTTAGAMLVFRKADRRKTLAYLPFLTAGVLLALL